MAATLQKVKRSCYCQQRRCVKTERALASARACKQRGSAKTSMALLTALDGGLPGQAVLVFCM